MMYQSTHFASFHGTEDEWLKIADHFERSGETRLAKTIRKGLRRLQNKYTYNTGFNLRFRDGSIQKVQDAINAVFPLDVEQEGGSWC